MIAPRLRLVLVMFLAAVPSVSVAGLSRAFFAFAFFLIGFALIVALCDLALGLGRYRTLQFSVPETLRGIRGERDAIASLEERLGMGTEKMNRASHSGTDGCRGRSSAALQTEGS